MVSDISQTKQIDPKQAVTIFKKLISTLNIQNRQITQEIDNTKLQICYFENNIKLIKSSKYYRFINFIKNAFKFT